MGWGSLDSIVGGVRGFRLMLFLFYINISGMCPQSCLSSQLLTILAPWVILCDWWSIPVFSTLSNCLPFPYKQ